MKVHEFVVVRVGLSVNGWKSKPLYFLKGAVSGRRSHLNSGDHVSEPLQIARAAYQSAP